MIRRDRELLPVGILLLLLPGGAALDIWLAPSFRGFTGGSLELVCTFSSSAPVSERLTVDWSYRGWAPGAGGKHAILHYQSEAFPAHSGPFKDRVLWNGDVTKGNASIILKNLTQNDNGTFSCTVQNPPDVSSEMPSTVLTVTERELPFRLSVAVLLVLLVIIPSLLVVTVHLLWMGKRFGFYGVNSKNTSIELLEGTDEGESDQGIGICFCCVSCFQESDEEDEDFHRFYPASESVT
ncbi:myelin protein zero-like protein 3 [Hemiscyllium ocellatum]|uniref:myelin protein zero-like protein 3 n=1 Tax=Hemiscyllium ocellatum TaxID=170820 RepID=UPI002966A2FE|nr:myelin protein zero-like protein 3 [Hemiscyllium ocellatum]